MTTACDACDVVSLPISVAHERILRLQRYRDLGRVPPRVAALAKEAALRAEDVISPQAVVRRMDVGRIDSPVVTIGDDLEFHSAALSAMLVDCRSAVVFVATLGPKLDEEVARLSACGALLPAVLMNTAGWAATETAGRALRVFLGDRFGGDGAGVTHRLGPGYADWPVTEQQTLFRAFGSFDLPVRLNSHALMWPSKSISGIFGLTGRPTTSGGT